MTASPARQEALSKRTTYLETARSITERAKNETRSMTADERRDVDGLLRKIDFIDETLKGGDIDNELDRRSYAPGEVNRYAEQQRRGAPGARGTVDVKGSDEFATMGEFLQSVIGAGQRGGFVDPRLQQRAALGLSEGIGSEGGFAVGTDFSMDLLAGVMAESTLAKRCRPIPISSGSNSIKLPAPTVTNKTSGNRWGGISLGWASESGVLNVSKPEIRMLTMRLNKLGGISYLTSELLEDSAALEAFVKAAFAAEFAWEVDSAIIRGTGAGTPLGYLSSPALVTQAKEGGQAADTIVSENIVNMFSRMPATSLKDSAWLINQACWPEIFKFKQVVKNVAGSENVGGAPMFIPGGGMADAPFGTLLGRPILPIPQASALGDVGDISFVNLKSYLLAQKGGLKQATSVHVAFLSDEVALRWILRIDGQPYLNAPITPAYGTATQSDFLALEAR